MAYAPTTGNLSYTITYLPQSRSVWKSTLPPVKDVKPQDFAWCALLNLAMTFSPATELESKETRIQVAGAVIRRWRKSLGVPSARMPEYKIKKRSPEEQVAVALRLVTLAMMDESPSSAATWLRLAEAALRDRFHALRRVGTITTTAIAGLPDQEIDVEVARA